MTDDGAPQQRLRVHYAKGDTLRYISHLDLTRTWERIFRRAGLPVAYSQGFNPRPRFQMAAALPVGVTGRAELLDLWLAQALAPEEVVRRLRPSLPSGLDVLAVHQVPLRSPSMQSQMRAADYRAEVRSAEPVEAVEARVQMLLESPAVLRQRHHKGKWQTYDLRPMVQSVTVELGGAGTHVLFMRLQTSPEGAGRPDALLEALGLALAPHTITRTNLYLEFDKPRGDGII
jgi:radical SAM-linked protein